MSIHDEPTPVTPSSYPHERVFPGALKRLLNEDWREMTAAANASPEHVSSLERWKKRARTQNPSLGDAELNRLAVHLKNEFYANLSRAGVQARQLVADIDAIEGTDDG